jgi:hypothetical protein
MPLAEGIIDIPKKSKLHQTILTEFRHRLRMAQQAQSTRLDAWSDAEDAMMSYVPTSEIDALHKNKRKDGMPTYTTIAVPYNYATLLSAHTYYTSVFLSRSPVLQVSGRHGESQQSEMGMEALLDYQIGTGGNLVPLFAWLLDPGKYGIGWLGHHWDEEKTTVVQYRDQAQTILGFATGKIERVRVEEEVITYAGHRFFNLRPQDAFPDPRVPAQDFQKGEFFIRFTQSGMHKAKQKKANGQYYNLEYITTGGATTPNLRDEGSPRVTLPNTKGTSGDIYGKSGEPSYINLHEFHWDIVPNEWGVGKSSKMQKMVFTIANETTIVSCQPLGVLSGKFPFDVMEHEIDAYPLFKRGLMEVMDPLNKTMEWLFNSHFYNVRAALNNQFIVDPSRVVMKDLENPEPGKLIRLKPMAYGSDTRSALTQLPVGDMTRSHVNDSQMVAELLQRVSGVNDTVMGMTGGGRKTATEVRSSTTFGINRLKTNCEYFSAMGFSPMTQKLVQGTQQMYDMTQKYRIVGNLAQYGNKFMEVNPELIAGFYDYVPVDGSLPVDRFAQANLWKEIMAGMAQDPQIRGTYDFAKIFGYVAHLGGIHNIDQFKIQVQDQGRIDQQVQAGNMVSSKEIENLNEPGQIPGMGPTG